MRSGARSWPRRAARPGSVTAPLRTVLAPAGREVPAPGARVARGQAILRLRPLAGAVDLGAAHERLELARVRVRRAEQLLEAGATSARALEDARAALAAAESAAQTLAPAADAGLGGVLVLASPDNGIMSTLRVAPGQSVAAATPLFDIVPRDASGCAFRSTSATSREWTRRGARSYARSELPRRTRTHGPRGYGPPDGAIPGLDGRPLLRRPQRGRGAARRRAGEVELGDSAPAKAPRRALVGRRLRLPRRRVGLRGGVPHASSAAGLRSGAWWATCGSLSGARPPGVGRDAGGGGAVRDGVRERQMMTWLVSASLRQRVLVVALAAALVIVGVRRIPTWPGRLPEFAPPLVEIQTEAPGLSTEEVEAWSPCRSRTRSTASRG